MGLRALVATFTYDAGGWLGSAQGRADKCTGAVLYQLIAHCYRGALDHLETMHRFGADMNPYPNEQQISKQRPQRTPI